MNLMNLLKKAYSLEDFIALIGDDYPLLARFKDTIQDGEWHSEGDVAIHTNMVLTEMYDLLTQGEYGAREQNILILAALFHDYAKPLTTREKEINGKIRITAKDHELIGASLLFNLATPFGLSTGDWWQVIQLVAYHQVPKMLVVKEKGRPAYSQLLRNAGSLRLLYILEMADMRGRTCSDKQEQLDLLEMFKLEAEDHELWILPYENVFLSQVKERCAEDEVASVYHKGLRAYEQGQIVMHEEEFSRRYTYQGKSHVVIMCGISGSGKTTYMSAHFPDYEVISLDDIRASLSKDPYDQKFSKEAVRIGRERLKEALRKGTNVIWDATSLRSDFRQRVAQLGRDYDAFVELVVIKTTITLAKASNRLRQVSVEDSVIDTQCKNFQLPSYPEVDKIRWHSQNEFLA
jgi:predicted kinase